MKQIRQPRQQRSIQTKKQILKAGLKLFSQKGIHGTNTKEIVKEAGVSIGSFYAYFKNKKVLLLEILEDYLDQVYSRIWKSLTQVDVANISIKESEKVLADVFKAYETAPEFHRQAHALRYSDPEVNKIFNRERKREVDQLRYILEAVTGRDNPKEFETSAILVQNLVESAVHTYMFLGPDIDRKELSRQLPIVILAFIDMHRNALPEE